MARDNVLSNLNRPKENIKCKYSALRHEEADIQSSVTNTLKSVTDQLKQNTLKT